MRTAAIIFGFLFLLTIGSCSRSDQETARRREDEAKTKAREAAARLNQGARKLGREVKDEAHALNRQIGTALNNNGPAASGTSQAQEKLDRGAHDLHIEADKAGVKLDRAALIAKVKAKLATNVGLSTVTGVDVDTTGQVVTLRGTVDSIQQKQMAEQAALQVSGVTKVIDDLQVKP